MSIQSHSQPHSPDHQQGGFPRLRWAVVLIGFTVIAGALLFTEHRAHVLGALIWLPFLLCPLMHFFMHGSHGEHQRHQHPASPEGERRTS